jgi:hypothetical protein
MTRPAPSPLEQRMGEQAMALATAWHQVTKERRAEFRDGIPVDQHISVVGSIVVTAALKTVALNVGAMMPGPDLFRERLDEVDRIAQRLRADIEEESQTAWRAMQRKAHEMGATLVEVPLGAAPEIPEGVIVIDAASLVDVGLVMPERQAHIDSRVKMLRDLWHIAMETVIEASGEQPGLSTGELLDVVQAAGSEITGRLVGNALPARPDRLNSFASYFQRCVDFAEDSARRREAEAQPQPTR